VSAGAWLMLAGFTPLFVAELVACALAAL